MITLFLSLIDNWENWDKRSIIIRTKSDYIPNVLSSYKIEKLRLKNAYKVYIEGANLEKLKLIINQLSNDENIIYVEPTIKFKLLYEPNDPYYSELWGLYVMYLNYAWNITKGSSNVKVCVIDTGIDIYHEDLNGNFLAGYDEVDNDNDISPPSSSERHGTHVAGTILAIMDNNKGIVGVSPNSKLLGCRALTNDGGTSDDIANCIMWCINNGARVINMSLGSSSPSSIIKEALDSAYNKNVIVVAAAGNDGNYGIKYPAAYNNVIAVGALDKNGQRASFSNYGPELDFVAPGVDILSTVPYNNQYAKLQGTSMATPHITGAVALILSINPNLNFNDVYNILKSSSIQIGQLPRNDYYGWGLVNVYRALLNTPQPTFSNLNSKTPEIKIFGKFVQIKSEKKFEIYSINGNKIASTNNFEGFLNSGIYFLKYESSLKKFIVP